MNNIYIATENIDGYIGGGLPDIIKIKKGEILYCDNSTTFDQNSIEFKRYTDNKFVILNREIRNFGLPKGILKYSKSKI